MEVSKPYGNPKNIFVNEEFNSHDSSSDSSSADDSDQSIENSRSKKSQIHDSHSKYTENSRFQGSKTTSNNRRSVQDAE